MHGTVSLMIWRHHCSHAAILVHTRPMESPRNVCMFLLVCSEIIPSSIIYTNKLKKDSDVGLSG